jgi:hypothetical protein
MMHNVQFVADYFVLHTTVTDTEGMDEEQIIAKANEFLKRHYSFDIAALSNDIEVEEVC